MQGKALQLKEVLLILKGSLEDANNFQEVVLSGEGGYTCTNMVFVRIQMTNIDKLDYILMMWSPSRYMKRYCAQRRVSFQCVLLVGFRCTTLLHLMSSQSGSGLRSLRCLLGGTYISLFIIRTYNEHITNISLTYHEHITNISLIYHEHITDISRTYHEHITNISRTYHTI